MADTVSPETMCHTPHQAVITSIPPCGGKSAKMSVPSRSMSPSPEFCMPVSMVSVLLSL